MPLILITLEGGLVSEVDTDDGLGADYYVLDNDLKDIGEELPEFPERFAESWPETAKEIASYNQSLKQEVEELVENSNSFKLDYDKGKQIQEILNRYHSKLIEERDQIASHANPRDEDVAYDIDDLQKDISYIEGLAGLFEEGEGEEEDGSKSE